MSLPYYEKLNIFGGFVDRIKENSRNGRRMLESKASEQLDPGGNVAAEQKFAALPLILLMAAQIGTSGDNGTLSIATGAITQALNASTSEIQMLNTVYSLVAGACMIVGGMLGTILGWKRNFRIGAALAAIGEFTAAFAPNVFVLTWGGRLLVGLGASLLIPSMLGLVPKIWHNPQHRAIAFGGVASASGIAIIFPIFLSILLDITGFRFTFGVLGAYFLIVLLGSFKLPPIDNSGPRMRFDGIGAGLAASGLFLFIVGISNVTSWGLWSATSAAPFSLGGISPAPVLTVIGIALLVVLVLVEGSIEQKNGGCLLPRTFLRQPQVLTGLCACTVSFFFMGMKIILFTPYMQVVLGLSATFTSLVSLVFGITMFIASLGVARVFPRVKHRTILLAGYGIVLLSVIVSALCVVPNGIDYPLLILGNALSGFGAGAVASQAGPIISLALDERNAAQSGGVQATCRNTGQAIAVALLGTIMLSYISGTMGANLTQVQEIDQQTATAISQGLQMESNETFAERLAAQGVTDQDSVQAATDLYAQARVDGIRVPLVVTFALCLAGSLTVRLIQIDKGDTPADAKTSA